MAQVTPLSPTGTKLELIPTEVMDHLLGRLNGYSQDNDALLAELFREKDYDYTSDDLAQLVETTTSIRTKISIIEMIAPKLIDPQERKEHFLNLFKFSEDKEKVEKALKGRQATIQNSVFLNRSTTMRRNSLTKAGRGSGRGSAFRGAVDKVIDQNRFAKSLDDADANKTSYINLSKAASMDDSSVQLDKLEITSRRVRVESSSLNEYKKQNSYGAQAPEGNPLYAQHMASKSKKKIKQQQQAVLENSRAFTEKKIGGVKLDTKSLGSRRFSSIKDVVAMFDKTKSLMSVEEQYGISKEQQEKEQQELDQKLQKQREADIPSRPRTTSVEIQMGNDGEEDFIITLDNEDEEGGEDEEPQADRKGLFGDDEEEEEENDDDAGSGEEEDFFTKLRNRQSRKMRATDIIGKEDGDADSNADDIADTNNKGTSDPNHATSESEQQKPETETNRARAAAAGTATESTTITKESNPTPNSTLTSTSTSILTSTSTSPSSSAVAANKANNKAPGFEPNKDLEGYLLKKSPSFVMGWQIRWFKFLDNGDIIYFKKEDSIKAQGTIRLKELLPKRKILVDRQHRFDLHARNRTYYLMATCKEDALAWSDEIQKRIKRFNDHL